MKAVLLFAAAAALIVGGVALVSLPAALVVAGLLLAGYTTVFVEV